MFQEMFEKATAKPTIEVSSLVKDNWYMIDLMDVRGSDAGMFDEMGSVYVTDIVSEHAE